MVDKSSERLPLLTGVRLCAALPVLSSYGRDSVYIHALLPAPTVLLFSVQQNTPSIPHKGTFTCAEVKRVSLPDPESASLPWITKDRLKRVAGASLLCFREGRMGIHHSACSATSQGFPPSVKLGMMPSRSVGYCGSSGWIETSPALPFYFSIICNIFKYMNVLQTLRTCNASLI